MDSLVSVDSASPVTNCQFVTTAPFPVSSWMLVKLTTALEFCATVYSAGSPGTPV